ncbi:MAG: hypothetical protein ACOYI7_08550 [Candidatus Excrementavichristensenella sp.]|jgi:hypothetical protein
MERFDVTGLQRTEAGRLISHCERRKNPIGDFGALTFYLDGKPD